MEDIRQLYEYLHELDISVADRHLNRLNGAIKSIGLSPNRFAYFFATGAPYRARLFILGRTSFWIVYTVNEAAAQVTIFRIWDSRQNPDNFDFA
jgi:plasmid stabilization system protein ParE